MPKRKRNTTQSKKNISRKKNKSNSKNKNITKRSKDKINKKNFTNSKIYVEGSKNEKEADEVNNDKLIIDTNSIYINNGVNKISSDLLYMHNIYDLYEDFEKDSESEKEETSKTLEIKDNSKSLELKKDKNIKTGNNKKTSSDNVDDIGCNIEEDSKKEINAKNIKDSYDYIFYKNRKFILDKNNIRYQQKNKNIRYRIYKCEFWRKNEAQYQKIKKIYNKNKNLKTNDLINGFCRGEIKYYIDNNIYILINMHSNACDKFNKDDNEINGNKEYISWKKYKYKLLTYLESQQYINKKEFINYSITEFNKNSYNFNFDIARINNLFYNWKSNSIKFTKYYLLENPKTLSNRDYLKTYINKSIYSSKLKKNFKLEYFIYITDFFINKIKNSNNIFIDGTFKTPDLFSQILIIQFYHSITNKK